MIVNFIKKLFKKEKKKIVNASKNKKIPFFYGFLLLLTLQFIANKLRAVIAEVWNINN
jgi:hypothetical protein